jgi:small subunit ribosomal protein S11
MEDTPLVPPQAEPTAMVVPAEAPKSEPTPVGKKKSKKKFVTMGKVFVQATYNNTIVTITDTNGAVLGWSSAGKTGFKGPKKSTPYAAGITVRDVVERIRDTGLKTVDVFVRGVGSGREAAVRALGAQGLTINTIKDITPIPHNGCRPRKVRRV